MASGEGSGQVAATSSTWEDVKRADLPTKLTLGIAGIFTVAGAILLIVAAIGPSSSGFVAKGETTFTFEVPDNGEFHRGLCLYQEALDNTIGCVNLAEYILIEGPENEWGPTQYRVDPDCAEGPTAWGLAQDPPLRKFAHFWIPLESASAVNYAGDSSWVQISGSYKVTKSSRYGSVTSYVENHPLFATECMENMEKEGNSAFTATSVAVFHVSSIMWVVGFYRLSAGKQPQALPSPGEVVEQSRAKAEGAAEEETV